MDSNTSSSSSEESSFNLSLSTEERLGILVSKELASTHPNAGQSAGGASRTRLVTWMADWCQDNNSSPKKSPLLAASVKILDTFTSLFKPEQEKGQLLAAADSLALGAACIALAAKARKIRLKRTFPHFQPGEIEVNIGNYRAGQNLPKFLKQCS